MRVKNRLSSYPILNRYDSESRDYKAGNLIEAAISLSAEFNLYKCTVDFTLRCKTIEELIREDKALYCVHVECPSTCYRKEYLQKEPHFCFDFSNTLVNESIEINTFVVLAEDIPEFSSQDFHPDYEGMKFSLKKHQILALADAVKYPCGKKNLDKISSIIKVSKLDSDSDGVMTVDTDDSPDYIYVGIQKETFDLYYQLGKNKYKKTALALVLYPALIVILERMYLADKNCNEDIKSYHWYQVIEGLLAKENIAVSDLDIRSNDLLRIAQKLFGQPVRAGFEEMNMLTSKEEENG